MAKNILIAAASACALLACATAPEDKSGPGTGPDPRNPQVYVVSEAGKCAIVVEPNEIHFANSGNGQAFPIIWHLRTPGYKFAQNNSLQNPHPIQGSSPGVISGCRSGGLTMQCTNNNTSRGKWKYDIKGVTADGGGCNPPDLDPYINND
jgi:hypothetical protein